MSESDIVKEYCMGPHHALQACCPEAFDSIFSMIQIKWQFRLDPVKWQRYNITLDMTVLGQSMMVKSCWKIHASEKKTSNSSLEVKEHIVFQQCGEVFKLIASCET